MAKGKAVNGMNIIDIKDNENDNKFCKACVFGKHLVNVYPIKTKSEIIKRMANMINEAKAAGH